MRGIEAATSGGARVQVPPDPASGRELAAVIRPRLMSRSSSASQVFAHSPRMSSGWLQDVRWACGEVQRRGRAIARESMVEKRTPRLRLLAATHRLVKAELETPGEFGLLIGAQIPADWPPEMLRDARPVFAGWHEAHPEWSGWLDWYAIRIDRDPPVLCGSVGFKGPPDTCGMIEIGYSVLPVHQNIGLATEMVATLVAWAFSQQEVRCVEAETTCNNWASRRVLEHNGFLPLAEPNEPASVRYRLVGERAGA